MLKAEIFSHSFLKRQAQKNHTQSLTINYIIVICSSCTASKVGWVIELQNQVMCCDVTN